MSYYECANCGGGYGRFPQVYVMLNSKLKFSDPDYYSKFDNKFENKFNEFVKEVAKENNISARQLYRVSGTAGLLTEVYKRYYEWLCNLNERSFCSIKCAKEWLTKKEESKEWKS